jgi:hypothetical protein
VDDGIGLTGFSYADAERCLPDLLRQLRVRHPRFPLSDVALQQAAADAAGRRLDVKPVRVFGFDEIHEAHQVMEANETREMVVVQD